MDELRLGDVIDDYCIKCRRLTNHAIVSLVEGQVAKVRCRSCYHDHNYLHEQAPPSKKDLKKAELFNAVLSKVDSPVDATKDAVEASDAIAASDGVEQGVAEAPVATEAPAEQPEKKTRTRAKKA